MDTGFMEFLKEFSLTLFNQDSFDDACLKELLDQVRYELNLDAVYVLETLSDRNQFYYAYYSSDKASVYDNQVIQFTDEEYETALEMYDEDNLCNYSLIGASRGVKGSALHYGFISGKVYLGSVGFRGAKGREWTDGEREILKLLGRSVKLFVYAKKTEDQLSWSAERTNMALKSVYQSIYNVSVPEDSYRVIQISEGMQRIIPVSGAFSGLVKKYVHKFVEPEFQDALLHRLSNEYISSHLTEKNRSYDVDYKCVHDGEIRWCRLAVTLENMTPEGKVDYVLLTLQDITTQVMEKDLSDLAFSLMRGGYYRIAHIHLNQNSMISLQAVRSEENEQEDFLDDYKKAIINFAKKRVLPEFQEGFLNIMKQENLKRIFDAGTPYVEYVYKRHVDDKVVWVRTEVVRLEDYTPENARVMWYVRDIAKEKAVELDHQEKLLQINTELHSALSAEKQYHMALLADSFFYYTFDVNDGMIREEFRTKDEYDPIGSATGQKLPVPFELFARKWYELYQPVFDKKTEEDIFTLSYLRKAFERGERILDVEVKQTPPEGSGASEFMQVFIVLSEDDVSGHIMACVIWKDVSEFRRNEIQSRMALSEAYEVANRASKAKTEFLSRMSHDIRTPMNAIIGMTAIAGTHLDDRERVADCLNKITVSSKHLLSLINEVLDMSKIESGKVDLSEENFVLSELVDNLILLVRSQLNAKHHELNVRINDVKHEKVIGDSSRLRQAFVNLMSNAIKYTPDGGKINLIISEKPCRQPQFGCYEFIFEDNGIGMDPEFVDQIFEPFARAKDSRVDEIQGTGLGMSITRNLVRMMNGNIKVESELGKGSRFIVTVFMKLQEAEDISYEEFVDLPVLVADDDRDTCESACCILDEIGMDSEWVLGGEEAVQKVVLRHEENRDYFAVILDWKMPDMDGIETTRQIRKQVGPDVPIIIISAYDWSDIELEARAAGADAFIGKPFFKSRFVCLFHDMLNGEVQPVQTNDVEEVEQQDFSGKRILLVEDNELNAEIAEEILKMANLEIDHAENGQVAVDRFMESERGYYDLIFMDVQMPVMNGNEAARAIRALAHPDAKRIPIVAMTANAFTEDVQAAKSAGMNEHIAKPLDFKKLVETLNRWL